jgi:hypothetical protein
MSAATFPPVGARARLFMQPAAPDQPAACTVVVALPPVEPDPANLLRPGGLAAVLAHEAGCSWPDAAGERLAAETVQRGGVAALAFACLADALACKARIGGCAA